MGLTEKQIIGNLGEQLAAEWLENRGYKIRDRNYRKKLGEIDIIAVKDNAVHFVEVKTVSRQTFRSNDYEPEDNIHPWKLKRLSRAIQTYLLEKRVSEDIDWQLDAVSVYLDGGGKLIKVELLEDIF